jgi:Uma2 family endonuclease
MSVVEQQHNNRADPCGRLRLRGVSWPSYRKISEALSGRHVRLTFDRGSLELMTISPQHGNFSRLLARFVVVLTEERGLPLKSFGDMTCDNESLQRGIEPDESFYVQSEPAIRGKQQIDLTADPPPDLGIEVDISRDSLGRLDVYAAIGVPEVWRFDGQTLTMHVLAAAGGYEVTATSHVFVGIAAKEISRFLLQANEVEENALVKSFRQWVRTRG